MSTVSLVPTIERSWIEIVPDDNPDVSYLYQEDPDFSERREAYERGAFAFVGVQACAEVRFITPQGGWTHGPVVKSPGLWGIEDDSGDNYLREVAEEEMSELADQLAALNVPTTVDALRNSDLRYR